MPTLNWIGKDAVRTHHHDVPFRLLREDPERAVGDPDAENLLVQGDNLLALKALLPYYAGQVKCVYIDPPYNTGNEGWAYNDNVNSPQIRRWLGKTVGKEAEDLSRHDKWLCMMYPRLMLLHDLLAQDGSFWMSIDDNEVHHARALLDEIFGRKNFVACVIWQKRTSPDARVDLGAAHDYILVYSKAADSANFNKVPRSPSQVEGYSNPDDDPRGVWASTDFTAQGYRPNQMYEIVTPGGKTYSPPSDRCWSNVEPEFKRLLDDGRIWFGTDGNARPREKKFLSESEGISSWTWWNNEKVGHNQEAKKELMALLPEADSGELTPKPTRLIERILEIATDPGDLVLDSFAGTGTTGHAVLKKNDADGYNRRFILVEMEEQVAENVALQRLRRAVEGYEYKGTDKTVLMEKKIGVRQLKTGNDIYADSEAIKDEREGDFDKIRRSMADGVFTLTGETKITDRKDGLGSGVRYATLGPVLMDANGTVRRDVAYAELARHIHYAETGTPLPRDAEMDPPLVATHNGLSVYLLYNGVLGDARPDGGNVLTRSVLDGLPLNGTNGPKIVYGVACRVSRSALQQQGVTFRQIPYEIRTA